MSDDREVEVYRHLRTAQGKYCYFLLAAAGASMAFAFNQTGSLSLSLSQIPLGFSVVSWAASFFFGCRYIMRDHSILRLNMYILETSFSLERQLINPNDIQAVMQRLKKTKEQIRGLGNGANKYYHLQLYCLWSGAVFYSIWHVFEMYLRG